MQSTLMLGRLVLKTNIVCLFFSHQLVSVSTMFNKKIFIGAGVTLYFDNYSNKTSKTDKYVVKLVFSSAETSMFPI